MSDLLVLKQFENDNLWLYYAKTIQQGLNRIRSDFHKINTNNRAIWLEDDTLLIVNDEAHSDNEDDQVDVEAEVFNFSDYFLVNMEDGDYISFSYISTTIDGWDEFSYTSKTVNEVVNTLEDFALYGIRHLSNKIKSYIDENTVELLDKYVLICNKVKVDFPSPYLTSPKISNHILSKSARGWRINIKLAIVDLKSILPPSSNTQGGNAYLLAKNRFENSILQ